MIIFAKNFSEQTKMNIEKHLLKEIAECVEALYGVAGVDLQLQKTRKEFEGDYTLVVFPLLRTSRKSPDATAEEIGAALAARLPEQVKSYNAAFTRLSPRTQTTRRI